MALSAHQQIAEIVRDHIAAWSGLPAGVTVQRVRSVLHMLQNLAADVTGTICVTCVQVDSEKADRSSDRDEVGIGVVVIAGLDSNDTSEADTWDLMTDQLRDYLRRLRLVTLDNGYKAERMRTVLPTPHDADMLYSSELFVSVIRSDYSLPIQVGADLAAGGP